MNAKQLMTAAVLAAMVPLAMNVSAGSTMDGDAKAQYSMEKPDLVAVAAGNDDFSTLVAAVQAAGLVEVLQGDGPFTVFAPTNAAFAALPEGTLEMLLEPANKDKLVAILTYHVVPGAVYAEQVVELDSAETVQGERVTITVEDGVVMVDGAQVVATDIAASNGVIHVIDAVILPDA